ncbi:MAG: hypothetical protein ACYS9X_25355 [Planctomycetota bacterium]|jgi:hypothetical protein
MRVAVLDGDTEAGPLSGYVEELARLLGARPYAGVSGSTHAPLRAAL